MSPWTVSINFVEHRCDYSAKGGMTFRTENVPLLKFPIGDCVNRLRKNPFGNSMCWVFKKVYT